MPPGGDSFLSESVSKQAKRAEIRTLLLKMLQIAKTVGSFVFVLVLSAFVDAALA